MRQITVFLTVNAKSIGLLRFCLAIALVATIEDCDGSTDKDTADADATDADVDSDVVAITGDDANRDAAIDARFYRDSKTEDRAVCECYQTSTCCDGCSAIAEEQSCDDDDLDCTEDVCEGGVCTHALQVGWCLIGRACYDDGSENPANTCQYCDTSSATDVWIDKSDESSCDDGDVCTLTDICQQGVCQGTDLLTCQAADECHVAGICDPVSGCPDLPAESDKTCEHSSGEVAHCSDNGQCIKAECTCEGSAICCANDCTAGPGLAGQSCEEDDLPCTRNVCSADGNCVTKVLAENCLINGQCYSTWETIGSGPEPHCRVCYPHLSQQDWTTPEGLEENACNGVDDDCDGETDEWPQPDGFEPNDTFEDATLMEALELDVVSSPSDIHQTWFHSESDQETFRWPFDLELSEDPYYWMCRVDGLQEGQTVSIVLRAENANDEGYSSSTSTPPVGNLEVYSSSISHNLSPKSALSAAVGPESGVTACDNTYRLECKVSTVNRWYTITPPN